MRDELLRPKSDPAFPLTPQAPAAGEIRVDPFVIRPESVENRARTKFEFALDQAFSVDAPAIESSFPAVNEMAAAQRLALLVANAETLLKHQEIEAARVLIYQALAENSEHPVALRLAASLLNPEKDIDQIIQIQKVICRTQYEFATVAELAHLFYKKGEDQTALEHYHEALSLIVEDNAGLFEVYKNVGNILTREKDFDGAEEFYNKAFTLNPDSDVLLVNLGTLALQRPDQELALLRFRRAIEINTDNDKAWVGLALVHQSMGDFNLAMGNIQAALDLNPANRTAVHVFTSWAVRDGKMQMAIERLEDYLARVEVDEEMSIVLIQLFCQMHRLEMAQLEVERVLLWKPENSQLQIVETEIRQMLAERQHQTAGDIQV